MDITSNNWSVSLDLNGGRIQELAYKGVKIFGTYQRMDGKIGNTHICAPSFDREGQEKYNLPFHGYARTLTWNIKQQTANRVEISTKTKEIEMYPAQLEISQEFLLDDQFTHTVSVKHISGQQVPVNIAIHYYWDTPKDWETVSLNDELLSPSIKTNKSIGLKEKNLITFPHAQYEMLSQGFRTAALWSSFKTDEGENKIYNHDFCCIEPIIEWPNYFGSDKSILHPGETISTSISIRKVV